MTSSDPLNAAFSLAAEFIEHTSKSVFLTGKAGTGKTTFLKHVASTTRKNFAIAAPTGVAAINAGGMTLHSLFQLPFGIYVPGTHHPNETIQVTTRNTLFRNLHISKSKRELLQELELLIIDEVSMVRCDMLDAVDTILRMVRKNQKPFGGVQLLFIGDLYQLSPVAKQEEWSILKDFYASPFFFHATVIQELSPLCLQLTKIYRQNEQTFIDLLNNIRDNQMSDGDIELLNTRLRKFEKKEGAVTLTTHNYKADAINASQLERLSGKEFSFEAIVEKDFPERNYPTDEVIVLKRGARIMFIKNDTSEEKRYYNGKMATVTHVDEDAIEVEFDEGETFDLRRETWPNIRYVYNAQTDEIEEEELGSFTQFPIRLAWAITIHKSQGLTFQRAIIDAGESFAPGQVYVALSRCTSLDGLLLESPISRKQIMTDPQVVAYTQKLQNEVVLLDVLQSEKVNYEKDRFTRLLDFGKLKEVFAEWAVTVQEKKLPDQDKAVELSKQLNSKTAELMEIASQTLLWIDRNFNRSTETGNQQDLIKGLKKSVNHFYNVLYSELFEKLQNHMMNLKGKSKVKKYVAEVSTLALLVKAKAEKIRDATWRGESLFEGNAVLFSKPAKSIQAEVDKPAVNSAWESKLLFDKGLTTDKIASVRGLAVSTIEGHIAQFVKSGDVDIVKLMSKERLSKIEAVFHELNTTTLSQVKEKLGEGYSYGEIRMVFNHLEFKKSQN
jgi:DNA-binding NarL/FixJ family response regulator